MIDVRPATPADARTLARLRWEFRAGRDRPTETEAEFVERCAAWMEQALGEGGWRAWIAVARGEAGGSAQERIVGQIWCHLIQKVPNPVGERERHAYVSNLYVRPDARGGVGTALLRQVVDWARANGVDRVVLWPSEKSVTLYARHGFVRDGDAMELTC